MKTKLKYLLPILFLAACAGNKETETTPGPLYPQPQTIELNNDEGYTLNTITGDTIPPIITESGDTLITGVPIPTQGKTIYPDSVSQPKIVPYSPSDSIYNAHPNVHKTPNDLTVISVNKDSLTQILLEEIAKNDTLHYLVNSTADTLKTGVSFAVTGKTVPTTQPAPTKALPPRFKDAAINNMQYLDVDQGMASSYVYSILEDKSGNLWFGTWGGGVSRYDGESFTHFTTKEGISNNTVKSILEDKSGNLWFGTWGGGVSRYDGESFTHFTTKEGLSNNTVYSILEDKSGNLWFGTEGGGVSRYDGESFTHFTTKEGLSNNTVFSILEDKSGKLWFGTWGGGVSRYDGESFTHFTTKEGLSNNTVFSILEDKSGKLWFGTEGGGVSRYDAESFTHFTTKEGLSNNDVYSILEDKSGNLWLSTENGLNSIKQNKLAQINDKGNTSLFDIFEKNDGLKAVDFYPNSVCLDSKSRMWWGSGKSLTMLDMNKFNIAQNPPVICLGQLEINQQFIDNRSITDSLNQIEFKSVPAFKNYPINLELPYHKNHLTFYFSAIDWSAPHKIQYSYIMEGLNTNWSPPSHEPKADYRNIPYGNYTFKVKAIGANGEWSEDFEYEFTIHPPWWHTWWARTGYGITALLLIFGFVRWRTAKLKERQKELETEVEVATKEIRVQKEQVEEAHKEITDSINYAERIQRSFLATDELLSENLNDYFVFFQPKEAVSGDFYWAGKLNNGTFAMVNADSTGHGVPGAIMSILNISSIEEAVKEGSTAPHEIFNKTRKFIIDRLKKDGSSEGGKDGMDASIICFDFEKNKFTYAAAQNPIWIIRDGELIEIKPEKMPIGKHDKDHIPFEGGEFEIQKGDQVYTLTDGFQDQFGGPKGKKFMVKKMREYVLSISNLPLKEQHDKIMDAFTNWKGEIAQVDDVCVIGVKI